MKNVNNLWCQEPPGKDEIESKNTGLEILLKLLTHGSFMEIVEKVLDYLDGTDLTALQIGHPRLDSLIKVQKYLQMFRQIFFVVCCFPGGLLEQ